MRYTPGTADEVFDSIEAVVKGLAMSLIELSVSRQKSGVYVRAIVYRKAGGGPPAGGNGTTGASGDMTADETDSGDWKAGFVDPPAVSIDDCARVHRAILPRLELAFPKLDIYIEVSSPGIERKIKDGAEFAHYIGRPVSCYRTDISGWTSGILV
ncbi:MAG: hypothetical protein LBP37_01565, partial [Spirochaetaceae bacterium]|nr:hypothetical protein [Spirochaetaceae bacterium]